MREAVTVSPSRSIIVVTGMYTASPSSFVYRIEDLHHEFTGIWEQDDVVVLEASIRYTKLDGEAVYIPVTMIIERDGETVTASRIYGDMAPLYDVDPDEAPLICQSPSNR